MCKKNIRFGRGRRSLVHATLYRISCNPSTRNQDATTANFQLSSKDPKDLLPSHEICQIIKISQMGKENKKSYNC